MVAATTLCVCDKLRYGHPGAVTVGIVTAGGFFTMLLRDILLTGGRGLTRLTLVHDILTFSWCSHCWVS